jgi:hypothetical protein
MILNSSTDARDRGVLVSSTWFRAGLDHFADTGQLADRTPESFEDVGMRFVDRLRHALDPKY